MNKMLQLVGSVALVSLDPRLDQQRVGVDTRLLQRQFEAVVLGSKRVLKRAILVDDKLLLFRFEHGFEEKGFGIDSGLLETMTKIIVLFGKQIIGSDYRG